MTLAVAAPAQSFKKLASFYYDGAYPRYMSLIQGADGNFYGTAPLTAGGEGVVFEVTAAGQITVVCYFGEAECPNGYFPYAGLIQDAGGNFYGTTWQGGLNAAGIAFEYTTTGQPITLHNFCSLTSCADGADPFAPLILARDGNFYATAFDGGTKGYGTVFQMTPAGVLTTLHSFAYSDGAGPVAGLVQGTDSNFYGTTLYGGSKGAGTVFEITSAGVFTTLYSFCSEAKCADGASPYAGLIRANDGNFYGTTYGGGTHGHGTVFEITAAGKLTTLYSFCSQAQCADGSHPYARVIQASDGNFYGTASQGGASDWGTVYQVTAAGQETALHSFCQRKNCADGADPVGGLLQASSGAFYGTTAEGGRYQIGTIFSLTLGSGQPETLLAADEPEAAPAVPRTGPDHPRWDVPLRLGQLAEVDRSAQAQEPANLGVLNCSPAPCVLPPTQASEGGAIVTDPTIVTDPLNARNLLLGSADGNCPVPSFSGFHLSRDGGSTWERVECAPVIHDKGVVYWPGDGYVGYDRNGVAYAAAGYGDSEGKGLGLVAVQKSTDGSHWGKPVIAVQDPGVSHPEWASLTIDTNPGSPWVNSIYLSAEMVLDYGQNKNQVVVSHSTDGGATWTQTAVEPVQQYPNEDNYTSTAVGKDGTVYVTWLRCRGTSQSGLCPTLSPTVSKSTDGGNTWSAPHEAAKVQMPLYWLLPNTNPSIGVDNLPMVTVDNSSGPYSGNLYVAMYTWTGAYVRVQVIRSTDGGATWSQPATVAPQTATHDQFFPAISVSPTGRVGVSWLDRRNDPGDISYQAFAAFSDDGGQHFGPNWQLTQEFSNPDNTGYYTWMGNHTGNTWRDDGTFIAAWMDSSNGIDMQEVVGGVRLK